MRPTRVLFFLLCICMLILPSCGATGTKPDEALWGKWAYTASEGGEPAFAHNLVFGQDGTLYIPASTDLKTSVLAFTVIAPGRIKISALDQSEVLNYELTGETLKLFFGDGYNLYSRTPDFQEVSQQTEDSDNIPAHSPTPTEPAALGWLIKENHVITPENAGKLAVLNQIGKGVLGRMVWSPRGDRFALSTSAGIYLYEGAHFQKETFFEMDSLLNDVAFLQDGKTLAGVGLDGSVRFWDLETQSENRAFIIHGDKMFFAFASLPQDRVNANGWPASSGTYEYGGEVYDLFNIPMEDGRVKTFALVVRGRQESQFIDPGNPEEGLITWQGSWRELNRPWVLDTYSPSSRSSIQPEINKFVAAFSPDDRFFATWGYGDVVQVWSMENGEEVSRLNTLNLSSLSMVFSPDGRFLAIGSGFGSVLLWEFTTGQVVFDIQAHKEAIHAITFSQDGAYLASGGKDQQILLWDVNTGQILQTLAGHLGNVSCLAFSPDGSQLVSGSSDGTVRFWDVNTGDAISMQTGYSEHIEALVFTPDGQLLAAGKDEQDTVYLWEISDNEMLRIIEGFSDWVNSMDFSTADDILATGGKDGLVRIWDLSSGKLLRMFAGNTWRIWSLTFSADGEYLAAGSGASVQILDTSTGTLLQRYDEWSISSLMVRFSPEDKLLISCGWRRCQLLNVENGVSRPLEKYSAGDFSPDGKLSAFGDEKGNVSIREAESWQQVKEFFGHPNPVSSVAFSPNSAWLLSGDVGGEIRFWDVNHNFQAKNNEKLPDQILRSVFSPTGSLIASYNANGSIIVWDAETGAILKEIKENDHASHIFAFSPDGCILAVSGADGVVRLWGVP